MTESDEATTALAALRSTRQRLAARAAAPRIRHVAFAVVMAGIVGSPALPHGVRTMTVALMMIAVTLIVSWDRRRTGMFVNGYRAGATRWMTVGLLVGMLTMYAAAIGVADELGLHWAAAAIGLAAGVFGYLTSLAWERVYLAELVREP